MLLHLVKSREKKPTTFPFSSATKLNLGQDVASSWKENLQREPPERLFCLLFNNPRVVNTWQVILPLIHALKFQVTEVRWFLGDTPDWPSQHGPNLLRWLFYRAPFLTSFAKVNIVQNQKFWKRKSGWLGWLLWFVSSLQSNPVKPDFKAAVATNEQFKQMFELISKHCWIIGPARAVNRVNQIWVFWISDFGDIDLGKGC